MKHLNINFFRGLKIGLILIIPLIFFISKWWISQNIENKLIKEFYTEKGNTMAIFYAGDGGWRDFSIHICNFLQKNRVSTLGINTISYFWNEKPPEICAKELEKFITTYKAKWHSDKIILVGYSFGADVIPAIVANLDKNIRKNIQGIILIAPSPYAQFEIKIMNLLFEPKQGKPILPDIKKIKDIPTFLICDDTDNSLCPEIKDSTINSVVVPGGHHFKFKYDRINSLIINKINEFSIKLIAK